MKFDIKKLEASAYLMIEMHFDSLICLGVEDECDGQTDRQMAFGDSAL